MKKNEKIDLVYKLCRYVVDTLFWGCMVVALFVVMQIFLFSSFKIPSNSMEPGLIAGDYVLVNKLIPGARLFNVFASLRGEQVQIVRLPGLREIRRNDVVVFNYPYPNDSDKIGMHMMKYYIKRCLGLPGDSLSIVNGYYRVNGIFEPVGNIEGQELFSVQSNKMLKDAGLYWSFPKDSLISWNVKNFGPLYLPRKGDVSNTGIITKIKPDPARTDSIFIASDNPYQQQVPYTLAYWEQEQQCFKNGYFPTDTIPGGILIRKIPKGSLLKAMISRPEKAAEDRIFLVENDTVKRY